MTPLILLEYLAVLCVFMVFLGGSVFLLMRRVERVQGSLTKDYREFSEKVSAEHGRILEAQMANAASLLELGIGMARGQGEIVSSLSSAYSRDHVTSGLKLVQLLLVGAGKDINGSGSGQAPPNREALERLLDDLTAPQPPEPPSTILPEEMN